MQSIMLSGTYSTYVTELKKLMTVDAFFNNKKPQFNRRDENWWINIQYLVQLKKWAFENWMLVWSFCQLQNLKDKNR